MHHDETQNEKNQAYFCPHHVLLVFVANAQSSEDRYGSRKPRSGHQTQLTGRQRIPLSSLKGKMVLMTSGKLVRTLPDGKPQRCTDL